MRLHLAYIAGLFDGEGSLVVHLQKQSVATRASSLHVQFSIYNQDLSIMQEILETLGCGKIRAVKCGFSGVYRLEFSRQETQKVLELLAPYIRVKREQVQLGLLALSAPLYKGRYKSVPPEEIEHRLSLVARSKELNARNGKAFRSKWLNSVDPLDSGYVDTKTIPSQAATGTGPAFRSKVLRKV
jgi:hypothetical protein